MSLNGIGLLLFPSVAARLEGTTIGEAMATDGAPAMQAQATRVTARRWQSISSPRGPTGHPYSILGVGGKVICGDVRDRCVNTQFRIAGGQRRPFSSKPHSGLCRHT